MNTENSMSDRFGQTSSIRTAQFHSLILVFESSSRLDISQGSAEKNVEKKAGEGLRGDLLRT